MLSVLFAAALSAVPVDPLAQAATLSVRISDPAMIRAAVRQAVADGALQAHGRKDTVFGADPYRGFAGAMEEARVPSCLHPDAMKHQPAKIGPVGLGGMLALPFLAAAIVRGKCN